ncbi:site-2 protease family protein [Chitinimonas sp.]|uniref:site-2 protease family protein n=1 Tax=Chitinimonas sp. TaxID=1934313 RepID=UPI0035B2ADAB
MQAFIDVITLYALPVIFALTIPEAAQAFVADKLGDRTARSMGRLTLNPGPHIDLVGTVLLPLGVILLAKLAGSIVPMILIGWAKPIPVDFRYLKNPKKALLWISLANPVANLGLAFMWAALFKLGSLSPESYFSSPMTQMAKIGILMNAAFAILMLIPILPYPGGRIVISLLPEHLAVRYAQHERWGNLIVLGLFITGLLGVILLPFIRALVQFIALIFGL